jgi:osmotically-inducible protein OsmY
MKKLLALLILFSISSCAPAVFSGTAFGGKLIMQDKTIGESFSDTSVWTKIKSKMIHKKIDNLFGSINIKVNEGRVLLTGTVPSRESIIEILKICWDTQGVKDVINELQLEKKGQGSIVTYAKDSWITTQVRSRLLFSDIKSINFSVETIDGIVYLFGIARSQSELKDATTKISAINGVKKILSYVRVTKDITDRIKNTKGQKLKHEYLDIEDIEDTNSKTSNQKFGKVKIEEDDDDEDDIFDKDDES